MAGGLFENDVKGIPFGYRFPAEWEKHEGTILVWPVRPGSFPFDGKSAKKTYVRLIRAITESEPVFLVIDLFHIPEAKKALNSAGIRTVYHHMSSMITPVTPFPVYFLIALTDDAWARDTAPTFVQNKNHDTIGIDWTFNAWGGYVDGLLPSWNNDDALAAEITRALKVGHYDLHGRKSISPDFVLEGGSIGTDGEGTLITTEACLLSKGRNPELSKSEIEDVLKTLLGIKKIIWLPHGIYNDETNEHVDNVCAFTSPGNVVLAWTDDEDDPQYEYSKADLEVLNNSTDAKGRKINVHKLYVPSVPQRIRQDELDGYEFEEGEAERDLGERLAASYVNFYITNNAVLVPKFGDKNDAEAVRTLAPLFPERKIIPVSSRSILLGGGNIHCITKEVPELNNEYI